MHAVVALQSRNGAIVGLETPDGGQTFFETARGSIPKGPFPSYHPTSAGLNDEETTFRR